MGKTAIILGATGLTGGYVLDQLLNDDAYEAVMLFSRSSVHRTHDKLKEYLGDLLELERFKNDFQGDEVFCCIGTTKAKTKNKERYKAIDYGIPVKAAKLSKENTIQTFVVISALGANPKSSVFYNKTKGDMEVAVLAEEIPHTYIVRPSLIKGERSETRIGEAIGNILLGIFRPLMIGFLKKYKPIRAKTIAMAMVDIAALKPRQTVFLSDELQNIGES